MTSQDQESTMPAMSWPSDFAGKHDRVAEWVSPKPDDSLPLGDEKG